MARNELNTDFEKRSYSVIFLIAVALLLVGTVWSLYDDTIKRRPWKKHQATFAEMQKDQLRSQIEAQTAALGANPDYQKLEADRAQAEQGLAEGEVAQRLASLNTELFTVNGQHYDFDIELRIVKSRLEQAWYEYEHALHEGWPTDDQKQHIADLDVDKDVLQKGFDTTKARAAQINAEILEIQAGVVEADIKLAEMRTDRSRLEQRLAEMDFHIGPFSFNKIPNIKQVVLQEFDRNTYDQPVARVDRCTSCHTGVDKPGFEDAPHPYRTHPNRALLLGNHPQEQFGCSPCHSGQGAAVNSPKQAHGEVTHWNDPLLRGEKLQSNCISCHTDVKHLEGADVIRMGENMFEELGCHGCHLVQGYEDLPKVGPNLRRIAAKAEPAWLTRWVTNPHEFRPNTRMPNFMFSKEQGVAIAAYLLSTTRQDSEEWLSTRPAPQSVDAQDAEQVARGQALVDSIGCRGCHGFEAGESPAKLGKSKDLAPNLSNVAEKTDGRWMYHWIRDPRGFSPEARMPSLRLTDAEASDITAFLLTLGTPKPESALQAQLEDPAHVKQGEALVRKYGCAGCHNVTGMEAESRIGVELTSFGSKLLPELFFGDTTEIPHTWEDWTFHKLKTPRIYQTERIEQVMPKFDLEDEDIVSVRHFLRSRRANKPDPLFRAPTTTKAEREIEGSRLVARYNCVGCHEIEGKGGAIRARYQESPQMAPPVLNGEGAKVQPDWFFGFLKHPVPLRPWLKLRMPTFGLSDEEARALVDYFTARADLENPYFFIDEHNIPTEHLEAALTLVSPDYFSCFSCHQQGDKFPEGPPEGWAPDLGMAHARLNPEWILKWLRNPQAVMPGTKMPSFYEVTEDGQPAGGPDDVLGGDNAKQIEAIRDYLMVLNRADGLLAQRGVKKEAEQATDPGAESGL